MKKTVIKIYDILLLPACFLFLLSTCAKIASYTKLWEVITSKQSVAGLCLFVFCIIAAIFTRPLYQEILAFRVPLKEWLRHHRLK